MNERKKNLYECECACAYAYVPLSVCDFVLVFILPPPSFDNWRVYVNVTLVDQQLNEMKEEPNLSKFNT